MWAGGFFCFFLALEFKKTLEMILQFQGMSGTGWLDA